jgi:hypothetical protein
MRRAVTLDARGIELDLSEEGDACIVYAISADGSFIDIIDEFQDLAVAKAFAEELAQKHDLPYPSPWEIIGFLPSSNS